jgi:hypothetical protein
MITRLWNKSNRILSRILFQIRAIKLHNQYGNLIEPFNENWFHGKRIAIVGGADSAFKEELGDFIDGFDVVVRINKGVEVIEKHYNHIGMRTDILFHCLFEELEQGGSPITLDLWKKQAVKKVIFSLNKGYNQYAQNNFKNFIRKFNCEVPFSEVSKKLTRENLKPFHPLSPTTGFIAINTIFNCKPAELYITGITFFKSEHNQDYRQGSLAIFKKLMKANSSHDPDIEFEIFKEMFYRNTKIISCDSSLRKLIHESSDFKAY